MERLKKITRDAVFVLQVLIVFTLLFENRIVIPPLLQAFGRMHPLLLHLPIGLLLVTVLLFYTRKYFEGKGFDLLTDFLLHLTALTASLTTLMGLFLSLEGSFGADQLRLHKWLGVALSFVCWALLGLKQRENILKPVGLAGVVLLILTGHYGANLTHGRDFVWAPLQEEEVRVARVITDSTALFTATIEPIFEAKCYGCHNPKKAKGDLILTSAADILRGGEAGLLWQPADAANSLLVKRLVLPLDHDDHMPPKDKAQLTEDEITFISLWIDAGADLNRKLNDFAPEDTLKKLAAAIIPRYQQIPGLAKKYTFRFASPDKVEGLNRPNRTVFQIARNEPAIQADFFLRQHYEPRHLEELKEVKQQLISLNVSKMPVKDSDLDIITEFRNLEVLNLNNTDITGKGLGELSSLGKLRSLSLSGTTVDAGALEELGKSKSLREVFIWNTNVSAAEAETLKSKFPHVSWNIGFVADKTEVLKLSAPLLRNKNVILEPGEKIVLKHNLPGTEMRYTLDGSEPDSINSPLFNDGLEVGNYATVKAKAYKEGWMTSDVAEFHFFRKGLKPDTVYLEKPADKRYPGDGPGTLVDGQRGIANFYRHPAWIAFNENDLVMRFSFLEQIPTLNSVTLSFARNNWYICMPPETMEVWGGNDPESLELLASLRDISNKNRPGKARIEGLAIDLPPSNYKHYKLVARPSRTIDDGNPKKRTLWLMVDEVFIN